MKPRLLSTISAGVIAFVSQAAQAVPVSGQGTWETTLQGRDLDGNAATFEAYYDTTLDITWLADANAAGASMTWAAANAWAAGLTLGGYNDWRLPTNTPINGSAYNIDFATDGTTDRGTTTTTTDGTDGGWRDGSGNPVSEMGHMYYVTLGNLGLCDTTLPWCTSQPGWGLSNTGPFPNIQLSGYWSGSSWSGFPWVFIISSGDQNLTTESTTQFASAVRSGDINAVPVPSAVWLFGSGLLGFVAVARRKKA